MGERERKEREREREKHFIRFAFLSKPPKNPNDSVPQEWLPSLDPRDIEIDK